MEKSFTPTGPEPDGTVEPHDHGHQRRNRALSDGNSVADDLSGVLDDAVFNGDERGVERYGLLRQAEGDLDRRNVAYR